MAETIRAVLFDVGNTLLHINHTVMAQVLTAQGHPVRPESVYRAECQARLVLDDLTIDRPSTESPFQGYFRAVCTYLGIPWSPATQVALDELRAYDRRRQLWTQVVPWSHEILQTLRQAGYILGVISNSDGSVATLLANQGLDTFFRFILDSFLVGVAKPSPDIFHLALEHTGTAPHETVYIGDLYRVDVLGAQGIGMHGILVDPQRAWRAVSCHKIQHFQDLPALLKTLE